MRLLLSALLISMPSLALAQGNEGCGAAVEFGKGVVNSCIENGQPQCRTQEYLDQVWSMGVARDYTQQQGGCRISNRLYFYMDGPATTTSYDTPTPSTSPLLEETDNIEPIDNAVEQAEFLANQRANAANNPALNPFPPVGSGTCNAPRPGGGCEVAPNRP